MTTHPTPDTNPEQTSPALTRRELLAGLGTGSLLALPATGNAAVPELPISSRELWGWVRAQQVIDPGITYLDTGSVGPTLRAALVAEYRAREAFNLNPEEYRRTRLSAEPVYRLLGRLAEMAGCDRDELAFTTGAAEALSLVANGLDLAAGDEIVTTTGEHDAALYPWLMQARRRGVVVKQVALPSPLTGPEQPLGLMAAAVTERTRVLAFSHVQHVDGAVLPVRELSAFARQRNILSVVNGAQALGMLNVNLHDLGCDFYAGSFHKWLNGPHGTGLLYVRRDALGRVWPLEPQDYFGWLDADRHGGSGAPELSGSWPPTLRKLATSFHHFWPLYQGFESVLDFHDRLGRERIEARVRELAIYTRLRLQQLPGMEILTPSHPALWGGILSFRVPGAANSGIAASLAREDRIVVGNALQGADADILRASLHIYNSHDDVERLLRGLQRRVRT